MLPLKLAIGPHFLWQQTFVGPLQLGHVEQLLTETRAGEIAQADSQYRTAITERSDLAAAHNGLGAALFAQGDLGSAEAELKSAAELDPKDPHPWLNLARIYKQRGDESAQESALRTARARDPALALADRR